MFKSLKNGLRRAGGGGVVQSGRIGGLKGLRASEAPKPRTVAYQPETPQEHAFDGSRGTSRVNE